jgi:hypothetical protein
MDKELKILNIVFVVVATFLTVVMLIGGAYMSLSMIESFLV